MKSALLSTMFLAALAASSIALSACAAPAETVKSSGGPDIVKPSGEASFKADVLDAKTPVVVDFYADWCGPCKKLGPTVEELAKQYAGKVSFYRVNIDNNDALANRYNVSAIPAVKVFKNGKIVGETLGLVPAEKLQAEIQKAF